MSATAIKPLVPFRWASLLALCAGAMLAASFPAENIWWLAPLSVIVLLSILRGRSVGAALTVGALAGFSFYLSLLDWITQFIGPIPWWALATVETLFFAAGALLISLAYRWWPKHGPKAGRIWGLSALVAGLWLLREQIASNFPYQGFAWGRIGQSQIDSPGAQLLSWVGVPGVTFLTVFCCAVALELGILGKNSWCQSHGQASSGSKSSTGLKTVLNTCVKPYKNLLTFAVLLLVLALFPAYPVATVGAATVGGLQAGSEKAGFFKGGTQAEIRDLHLEVAQQLETNLGKSKLDLLILPEGAFMPDPMQDSESKAKLQDLQNRFDTPVLVGVIREAGDQQLFNSAQLWQAGKQVSTYDKHRPVPFGEYVPDRQLWRRFAPTEVDLITRDYTPGTTSAVLETQTHKFAVGICFDVIDDQLIKESIDGGAQFLVYPTNNADFSQTDELSQQLAFARIRALESRRSSIQVSTVGYTAVIGPDGKVQKQLPWYTKGALVQDIEITSGITSAIVVAIPLAWGISCCAAIMLLALGILKGFRRKHGGETK